MIERVDVNKIHTSLSDSKRIWSYSDKATKKMIDVTFSKQWIHFLRSDLWPPTSTILQKGVRLDQAINSFAASSIVYVCSLRDKR